MDRITVLLADDDEMVLEALADVVRADPELELIGTATSAEEAIRLAIERQPQVAVVDIRMPDGGGPRVVEELREAAPHIRVLAHSALADHATVVQMLERGAVGYLLKGTSPADIRAALHRAAEGQETLSPELLSGLVRDLASHLRGRREAALRTEERTARIERAVAGEGWHLVFQPIVDLATREVVGIEALARFTDPPGPPQVWFAEAAEVGLGVELELAAADAALRAVRRIPPNAYLAINVSHRTLLSPTLLETLRPHADRIVLELTEHQRIDDYEQLATALDRLRSLGARVAIDDAGAGFASLRHILNIRPDIMKLDVDLTRGIDVDPARRALSVALISFAEEMGMAIVAEGVETDEELRTLQELGVRLGQGYHLGRPAPLGDHTQANEA
jgi:EAL domain-containing protein (putative c-di-GMP-specific phosphodiesterase class I)/ActR/RegA family two-component response regulator